MDKHYYAFISHSNKDKKIALWLRRKIDNYHIPVAIQKEYGVPQRLRPNFTFQTDLAGIKLKEALKEELDDSRYLIVVCSPSAACSEYVNEEVQRFIDTGRADKIIPFIVEGEPNATNSNEECFCPALLSLKDDDELRGVNMNETAKNLGSKMAAVVNVIASMLGVKFDVLWNKYKKVVKRKRIFWGIGCCVIGVVAFFMAKHMRQMEMESLRSRFKLVAKEGVELVENGDSYLARLLAINILPENVMNPNKPYTPEAEALLRKASCYNTAVLWTHDTPVQSAVFSPNGDWIAASSFDGAVLIWNAESGALKNRLVGHHGPVTWVEFSQDGEQIVSASTDLTVKIWDAETFSIVRTLVGHTDIVNSCSFNQAGDRVVSASNDGTIKVWDARTGFVLKTFKEKERSITSAVFTPDGKRIVSSSEGLSGGYGMGADGKIVIWDIDTDSLIRIMDYPFPPQLNKESFALNGELMLPLKSDVYSVINALQFIDTTTGDLSRSLNIYSSEVRTASFSSDRKKIVSISSGALRSGSVLVFDSEKGRPIKTIPSAKVGDNLWSVAISPDGTRLITVAFDNAVRIWDIEECNASRCLHEHTHDVGCVCFSPDGRKMASASGDSLVKIWETEGFGVIKILKGHGDAVNCVKFDISGKRIVSVSRDGSLIIWDANDDTIHRTLRGHKSGVNSVDISPNGAFVASASSDHTIKIWDAENGKLVRTIAGQASVYSVAFSPCGKYLASVSDDGLLSVWNVNSFSLLFSLQNDFWWDEFVSYSPDGRYIATASYNNFVVLRDANTGQIIRTMEGHNDSVESVEFSPDGRCIVSASKDGTAKVWDVETGSLIQDLNGCSSMCCYATFSPDGKQIVSAFYDGTIRIWDFPPLQELIDQTRERFKDRPLTPEERHQYYLE